MFLPLAFIFVGLVALLNNLGVYSFELDWSIIWPLAFIVYGLSVLLKKGRHCGCGFCPHCKDCDDCTAKSKSM